jgi:hypothetical protein
VDWLLVLTILGAVGSIFGVLDMVLTLLPGHSGPLFKKFGSSKKSQVALAVLFPVLTVVLTAVSVYLATVNREITEIRTRADGLLQSWSYDQYADNSSNLGVVMGGLNFVERHSNHIPVTVDEARALAKEARSYCLASSDISTMSLSASNNCTAAAGGMRGLIRAIRDG